MRESLPRETSSTARDWLPAVLVALWGLLGGCDVPPTLAPEDGPVVIAVEPGEGSVTPRNPRFVVRLDRPLAPLLPTGSALVISGARRFPVSITSDPVARTLEVTPRSLPPNAAFRLELRGLVDLDGRVMADDVVVRFRTDERIDAPRPSVGWSEAQIVLEACAACHGPEDGALGLDLSSAEGIARTAIGVPAREVASPVVAGLYGLSRITPGSPSLSYAVWKLSGDPHVPGGALPEHDAIPLQDAQRIVEWVRAGAPLE